MKKIDVSEIQGPLTELLQQIGGENGRKRFEEFKLWLKKVTTSLLFLRTVRVVAQSATTTSEDYFKEAGVIWTGKTFKTQFLDLEVKATEEAELKVHQLTRDSLDAPILAELGDKAETSVSQFRAFLAENRQSSEWFIFYLRGKDGNLWAVCAYWRSARDGWLVDASSVTYPFGWGAGYRVVSSN